MNHNFVDYKWDLSNIDHFFEAAYEKCNLHPSYVSVDQFIAVLQKEIAEAVDECKMLSHQGSYMEQCKDGAEQLERAVAETEVMACKGIMELLQVLSVCQKWRKQQDD